MIDLEPMMDVLFRNPILAVITAMILMLVLFAIIYILTDWLSRVFERQTSPPYKFEQKHSSRHWAQLRQKASQWPSQSLQFGTKLFSAAGTGIITILVHFQQQIELLKEKKAQLKKDLEEKRKAASQRRAEKKEQERIRKAAAKPSRNTRPVIILPHKKTSKSIIQEVVESTSATTLPPDKKQRKLKEVSQKTSTALAEVPAKKNETIVPGIKPKVQEVPQPDIKLNKHEVQEKSIQPKKENSLALVFTNYEPTNYFAQLHPWHYPCVKMPHQHNCMIHMSEPSSQPVSELNQHIYSLFKEHYRDCSVLHNQSLPSAAGSFNMDIACVYKKGKSNLFINIEIDETNHESNTISVEERDAFFTDRGWTVIRFSEKQARQQPHECLAFTGRVIRSIFPTFNLPPTLVHVPHPSVDRGPFSIDEEQVANQ